MLTNTSEYALRAVIYLALRPGDGPVKLDRVAEALDVPRNYLSKTLHQLARQGVLVSERGPAGGFRLARPPAELTLAEVVETFEPARLVRRCLLGLGECSDETPCAVHERWKVIAGPMRAFFRDTTVADLLSGAASYPGALTRGTT